MRVSETQLCNPVRSFCLLTFVQWVAGLVVSALCVLAAPESGKVGG